MNRKQSNFCGNFPVTDGEGKPLKVMVGLGCMAEFCVVSRANLIKLRPEMPLAKAALVGCATVTGYGTRRADQRRRSYIKAFILELYLHLTDHSKTLLQCTTSSRKECIYRNGSCRRICDLSLCLQMCA